MAPIYIIKRSHGGVAPVIPTPSAVYLLAPAGTYATFTVNGADNHLEVDGSTAFADLPKGEPYAEAIVFRDTVTKLLIPVSVQLIEGHLDVAIGDPVAFNPLAVTHDFLEMINPDTGLIVHITIENGLLAIA